MTLPDTSLSLRDPTVLHNSVRLPRDRVSHVSTRGGVRGRWEEKFFLGQNFYKHLYVVSELHMSDHTVKFFGL